MNPIRRRGNNEQPIRHFRDEMDGMMRRFFTDPFFWDDDFIDRHSGFRPVLNIEEKPDRYVVEAEVPGMNPEDIHIEVSGNVLTIHGERRRDNRESDDDSRIHRMESSYGAFQRSFTLPDHANLDDISADSRSGVLYINVPKQEEKQPRKIEVRNRDH